MKELVSCFVLGIILVIGSPQLAAQKKGGGSAAASPSSSSNTASSTPSAGSSAAIESQMLAFGALDDVANAVASQACSKVYPSGGNAPPNQTIVIFDQASFANIQAYQGFVANADALKSLYYSLLLSDSEYDDVTKCQVSTRAKRESLFPKSPEALATAERKARADAEAASKRAAKCAVFEKNNPGVPCPEPRALGASSTIDPFSDATSLLSAIAIASNSESPGSIVIPDSAMAVAVTDQLVNQCSAAPHSLEIIYPPLFGRSSNTDVSTSDMQSVIQELHDVRACTIKEIDGRTDTWAQKQLAAAPKPAPGATAANVNLTSDPITTPELTDVNGMYDSFMNVMLQANSTSGTYGSGAVEQGYQLATVLAGPIDPDKEKPTYSRPAYVLLASILSAGGTTRDHKSLWTALGTGDKFTFSGGVIVNVALWQATSKAPLYTKILRYRVPFEKVDDPTHPTNGRPKPYSDATKGDNLP